MCFTPKAVTQSNGFRFLVSCFYEVRLLKRRACTLFVLPRDCPSPSLREERPSAHAPNKAESRNGQNDRSNRESEYRPLREARALAREIRPSHCVPISFAAVHLRPLAALLIALCNQGSGMNWLAGFDPRHRCPARWCQSAGCNCSTGAATRIPQRSQEQEHVCSE